MAVAKKIFYIKNSQFLEIDGLKDQSVTPAVYMNAATITATLVDSAGVTVPGFTGVTGVYIVASNGTYRFQVDPSVFNPALGGGYVIQITGNQGGKYFYGELPAKVATRQTGLESSS